MLLVILADSVGRCTDQYLVHTLVEYWSELDQYMADISADSWMSVGRVSVDASADVCQSCVA